MQLRDLTRDVFLFAATFRERLERNKLPSIQVVYQEVKGLFAAMDSKAMPNPAISAQYQKIRYGLVALVDEIIVSSNWPESPTWPVLELEYYGTNVAGNRFVDFINSLTPADTDLVEASFYILALGFRGEYIYDESKWEETLIRLYRMLPHKIDQGDFKLSPEAYHVIRRKAQRLDPLFTLWRSIIVFICATLLMIVMYQVVWISVVKKAKTKSQEVLIHIRDDGLRESLKDVKE